MGVPTSETLAVKVDQHKERLDKHEKVHEKLWKKIDLIENRLPIWATLLMAVLTALIGALLRGTL